MTRFGSLFFLAAIYGCIGNEALASRGGYNGGANTTSADEPAILPVYYTTNKIFTVAGGPPPESIAFRVAVGADVGHAMNGAVFRLQVKLPFDIWDWAQGYSLDVEVARDPGFTQIITDNKQTQSPVIEFTYQYGTDSDDIYIRATSGGAPSLAFGISCQFDQSPPAVGPLPRWNKPYRAQHPSAWAPAVIYDLIQYSNMDFSVMTSRHTGVSFTLLAGPAQGQSAFTLNFAIVGSDLNAGFASVICTALPCTIRNAIAGGTDQTGASVNFITTRVPAAETKLYVTVYGWGRENVNNPGRLSFEVNRPAG